MPRKIKGFTLVEIMVTLTIMGMLAGTGIMMYQKSIDKARFASVKDSLKTIVRAISEYEKYEGVAFYKIKDLKKLKKYIDITTLKDPWGHPYYCDGTFVYSAGKDGIPGTADDIQLRYRRQPLVLNSTFLTRADGLAPIGWNLVPVYRPGMEKLSNVAFIVPDVAFTVPNSLCIR